MKKLTLILFFVLLAVSWVMAQSWVPPGDTLGAHNNGGRGCAGCHAPHSGNAGSGGETIGSSATGAPVSEGGNTGDYHLWATDMSIITQETLQVGGGYDTGGAGYTVYLNGANSAAGAGTGVQWAASSPPVVAGIASCLSCHDGNVSKGAMMTGKAYEQAWNLLPTSGNAKELGQQLYGAGSIPTWLGNDGGTLGDYLNDHPVGPSVNYNDLAYPNTNTTTTFGLGFFGLTYAPSGNPFAPITWTATGTYAEFLANYGAPAVNSMVIDSVNTVPYVVCTTCHNQHYMNVYQSPSGSGTNLAAINLGPGNYATYFFVNSPYNPGAAWTPKLAPSTTQFCRQCHFGQSNENLGTTGVGTAY